MSDYCQAQEIHGSVVTVSEIILLPVSLLNNRNYTYFCKVNKQKKITCNIYEVNNSNPVHRRTLLYLGSSLELICMYLFLIPNTQEHNQDDQ